MLSNIPIERFGVYLLTKGILTRGQLEQAIAKMPKYQGRMGETLIGLNLMKLLDVFRHLSEQVRKRVIDLLLWREGEAFFEPGKSNPTRGFPLGLETFEILGRGASSLDGAFLRAH